MFLKKGYDDFMQVIYIGETIWYAFKLLPFLRGNDRIKNCISYFEGAEFQPQDNTEKEILNNSAFLFQVMSKFYIVSIGCAEILYAIPALFSDGHDLPMPVWLPYSVTSSSVIYYVTYFYLCIAVVYTGFATSPLDPLIGGLVFQAVSQLKILKHRIQNPQNFVKEQSNTTGIYQTLAECVDLHNAILKKDFCEYEECFSWTIFNQFLGTTSVLCFICVAITTVPLASVDTIKYTSFFFVVNCQVLFYCYFGTLLYEESDTLVTAIYLSHWYEYPIETQKLLLTLMERSKQPLILSVEKLLDLTLDTFTEILKRSYSLVTILK
ncbi:hypothetical protein Zmor_002362 [Zophobas morio]|uniref:Odorant receptor n=1 Tax=Zophobas morio TaxID=2755281 RepID=A0AA38J7V2_9CUCU|nr:hypothetical protein Zmor_002362 [Zophobas morio]